MLSLRSVPVFSLYSPKTSNCKRVVVWRTRNCVRRACDSWVKSRIKLKCCVTAVGGVLVSRMKVHVFECRLVCDVGDSNRQGACVKSVPTQRQRRASWWETRWWQNNYATPHVSHLSYSLLSLSLIGLPRSCDLMLYFFPASFKQLRLHCFSLRLTLSESVCVYTNMCCPRRRQYAIYRQKGMAMKWDVVEVEAAQKTKQRDISGEGRRTDWENGTRRNAESGSEKSSERLVNPAIVLHMPYNIRK